MIIVDTNVLLYATNENMARHAAARRWLEGALNSTETVGFAWVVLLAYVRLSTLPALFPKPLGVTTALGIVDAWLQTGVATIVEPTARHSALLRGLLDGAGSAGNLVTDAHLAALCVEHGARMCTFDRDFQRFPGLEVLAPE